MGKAVEFIKINKYFPGVHVLKDVSFSVEEGEVHALLGENGAGKSTILNILHGVYSEYEGTVKLHGETVHFMHPNDAIRDGKISKVHQETMVVEELTVGQNVTLGYEPKKGLFVDFNKMHKDVDEILSELNCNFKSRDIVRTLTAGQKQMIAIAKALYHHSTIISLDEPTASLTPQEIEGLMEIIDNLTADGKSVILITHKLKEITASSDNCTIIRQGKYIQTVKVADVNENELAAMMVGRDVNFKVDKKDQEPGEVVLDIEDLHAKDYRGVEILKGFHLNVRRGEIVGLAGVDGNGQTELVEVLTGLRKAESGKVTMLGKDVFNKSPKESFDNGISSIPADRQKHGLILEFSNEDNLILQHIEEEA